MASTDEENEKNQGSPGNPGLAQTTDFEKGTGGLGGVSDLFGLKGQTSDTEKPTGQTGIFTPSGEAPTALFTPLPDDATPRTLQGRYRLVAQLGLGGMGVTYRAWDSKEGVPVVIKMPRKDVRNNPEIMDRFNREVRTMLGLSHEHIVPITDHGEEEGCPFVAMRFLPGGSLSEYRGRDETGKAATLSPATLHFWLPGIARALDFMHSSGVLHRDVKPGNIFLDGFLKPFLGDFGIAKVVDDSAGLNREYTLTATRMAVGTPEYMAPELFRPRATPDGRVDQYALAVTVYEMLAGRKPFRGDGAHIIVEHASKDVPPLQEFCPDVPKKLAEAVHKALAKNPEDRFATCSEFAEGLITLAPPLKIDTSRARLLCPSCRAILRVPATTAGKRGTCPKCKSPMAVADDLGSLWLGGEDRSTVSVASVSDPEFAAEEAVSGKAKVENQHTEPTAVSAPTGLAAKQWARVTAALAVGLVLGLVWGRSGLQALKQEIQILRWGPTLTNSIAIKLRLIPAGTFTMGQANSSSDETPHQVTLTKPFYIGIYEVTNAEWRRVMGNVPSSWKDDDRPVEQVSWDDAVEFCRQLSALPEERQAGRVYRLPTEAEWEYACRAGTKTEYSFGDDESQLGEYGWFEKNSGNETHPVGKKKPNAWGLYDMHGNVWEWVNDWYGKYPTGAVTDPQGPSFWASDRVPRGGGWNCTAGICRSAPRDRINPSDRSFNLGLRLALSPSGVEPPEAGAGR